MIWTPRLAELLLRLHVPHNEPQHRNAFGHQIVACSPPVAQGTKVFLCGLVGF